MVRQEPEQVAQEAYIWIGKRRGGREGEEENQGSSLSMAGS